MAGYSNKVIVSVLEGALNRWIKQIENDQTEGSFSVSKESVIKAIREDSIITGGAISSMLLGEKPNDYDIYFRSIESAKIVAQYYLERMKNLKHTDMISRIELVPNDHGGVAAFIKSIGVIQEETDVDKYEYFEAQPEAAAGEFVNGSEQLLDPGVAVKNKDVKNTDGVAYITSNAITLKNDIQVILRFCGEPEEIHKNYDFVHATCWYDAGSKRLVLPEAALTALLQRRLVYVGSKFPVASLFRVRKFIERGFTITAGELTKIAFDISNLDLKNINTLKDQLLGVDQAYFNQIIGLLSERKEIDRTYLIELIDRVF